MSKWTQEQLAAIEKRESSILVSASAGSGKTAVLVERIIGIITDKKNTVDIDNLLVVTFTSAAAAQMRERIEKAVREKIEEQPDNEHILRQLTLLNHSYITTIHSFCMKVIRDNYIKAGVDPNFRIADENECAVLTDEVMEELFESEYSRENNEDFLDLVEAFSQSTSDSRLKELVTKVYSFLRSMPYYTKWLDERVNDYSFSEDKLSGCVWAEYLREICRTYIGGALEYAEKALEKNAARGYEEALKNDVSDLEYMRSLIEKDIEAFGSFILNYKFQNIGRTGKDDDKQSAENIKGIRDTVKKSINYLRDNFFYAESGKIVRDMKDASVYIKSLAGLIKKFDSRYSDAKRGKNIADFSDLEHLAIKVLTDENGNPTDEAKELQLKFYEVMTDEYQDSNPVQELILKSVSGGGRGLQNRFMVGDVKQSIYRFRQAAPELFTEKYESYKRAGNEVKIDLIKNFRSRKEVLDSTNFIFGQLFSNELGEMEYTPQASLKAGAVFDESDNNGTELDIIETTPLDDEDEDDDITSIELEFMFVAKRIRSLVSSGFKVKDEETGHMRDIAFRDIVILLRTTKNWADIGAQILSAFSLPAFSDVSGVYLSKKEIKDVMSIIRVVDNFRQDIPLMAALKIPFYGVSDEELIKIRLSGDGEFCECLKRYSESGEDEALCKKTKRFISDVETWKNKAPFISVRELLWDIYTTTGYYDYCLTLPFGAVRQANLRMLLERAQSLESTSMKGLFNFVRYIEKVEKSGADIGEAKIEDENAQLVRIMSIHKSKGLEFPVVFICGLGKKFNLRDSSEPVILHKKMGIACDFTDIEKRIRRTTLSKNIISDRLKNESLSEEMRILYVAMTRAKEKLIMTGTVKSAEKSCQKWAVFSDGKEKLLPYASRRNADCFLDWIGAALSRHKKGEIIRDIGQTTAFANENGLYEHVSKWDVNIIRRSETTDIEAEKAEYETIEKTEPVNIDLHWKYENEAMENIPSNISIADLKAAQKSGSEKLSELKKPEFISGRKKSISAVEKGTAVHSVLEYIDFSKKHDVESVQKAIDEMTEKKLLSADEAKTVEAKKILAFLDSDLGQRIRSADEVKKEAPFAMSLSPFEIYQKDDYKASDEMVLIHGIIDCFFIERGKIVLIDYKTDISRDENEEVFIKKYLTQLKVYAMAIERTLGRKPDEAYIYSFALGHKINAGSFLKEA